MILDNLTLAQRHKLAEHFWSHVDVRGKKECWPWMAFKNEDGYGRLWVNGRMELAHRIAFELGVGPIPEGMEICHHCDFPACCNPDCLFSDTHAGNVADMVTKGRQARGETSGNAKLTEKDIPKIKALRQEGLLTWEIADRFGVSRRQINRILSGRHWSQL